jgi:ABC-type multidrug transport system ATPase subunit
MDRAGGNAQALEIAGLRKTFGGQDDEVPVRALRGLDMTVSHGEFVAVMGPSDVGNPRC